MPLKSKSSLKPWFALALIWGVLLVMLSGCQGLKTRDEAKEPKRSGPFAVPSATPTPLPGVAPIPTSQPTVDDHGADALPTAPPPAGPETFLSKELPKVGVILGPGGLKTYAHIGVLREFARARIPVHAVTGLEWGAMMAAFFADKGLANDIDWKAFRLRDSDVPSSGMLGGYRAKSMSDFASYLAIVFPGGTLDRAKIPFGCPSVVKRDRLQWQAQGAWRDVVARCLPYPPLLAEAGDSVAAADAVAESAAWLRAQGANLIVLVNVLGAGETLSPRLAESQYGASVLWTEVRRSLLAVRAPTVNWVVTVNTSGQKLDDFAGRRAAVEAGARAATDLTQKLSKQYGF